MSKSCTDLYRQVMNDLWQAWSDTNRAILELDLPAELPKDQKEIEPQELQYLVGFSCLVDQALRDFENGNLSEVQSFYEDFRTSTYPILVAGKLPAGLSS